MFKSVRLKLTLWYVGTIGVLVLIFSVILYLSLKNSLEKSINISLRTVGEEIEHAISENPYKKLGEILNKERDEELSIPLIYAQITEIQKDGNKLKIVAKSKTLFEDSLPISERAYKEAMQNRITFETVTVNSISKYPLRIISLPAKTSLKTSYIVQVATSLKGTVNTLRKLLIILFVSGPTLLFLSSFGGYFLVKKTFLPVKKIVRSAKRITAEDLSHRIEPIGTKDEIGELIETFNDMISRLERSFNQIKQFSSDTSHELKTPLTVIKGEIEVTLRKERKKKEYKNILKSILEEVDKLQKTIDSLLLLSQMDSQNIKISFKKIPIDELLLEAFEEIERLAKRKNLYLILKKVEQINIEGDKILLKRLFTNIIDNAIKYTQSNGIVEISLEKEGGFANFTVKDTGVGIPSDSLPYIFDRFYMVDKARSREIGGSGLGLAIAQWIAKAHNGRIEVRSKLKKGSTFVILLPLRHSKN